MVDALAQKRRAIYSPLATGRRKTDIPAWWLAGNAENCLGAWRSVNTPGSPWGPGPASYAESLVDLPAGANNLYGGVAPSSWDSTNGWFWDSNTQYLFTGIVPSAEGTLIVRFSGCDSDHIVFVAGILSFSPFHGVFVAPRNFSSDRHGYTNGAYSGSPSLAPRVTSGIMGVSGRQGYLNGLPDGGPIPAWLGAPDRILGIGKLVLWNGTAYGTQGNGRTHYSQAAAYYATPQSPATMLALAQAMAAL